jgi:atypical dual specificity phosphatase
LVSALPNRAFLEQRTQTQIVSAQLRANGFLELARRLEHEAVELPIHLQRELAVMRALISEPLVLFADEPTAGLDDDAAVEIIATLRLQANTRSVMFVTHNQRLARAAGGTTVLLAGGRVQEAAPTGEFFSKPRTELGRQFVRSGGCPTPDPPPVSPNRVGSRRQPGTIGTGRGSFSPRSFFWVRPNVLGGLARPGIIDTLEDDLAGLKQLGVSVLVTLEEERTVEPTDLADLGIRSIHFPIADMGVPTLAPTIGLCRQVHSWTAAGDVVAFHCRAGHGRTGTLLACQLITSGVAAGRALEFVRSINPRCVQTEEQAAFLRSFEAALRNTPLAGR